jgi:basic amino acid/polyamine antiporter, APA family
MKSKRDIGFWPSLSLVMGNMIGSGIFLLPATLAVYGQWSFLGWALSTAGALLLARTFAQLSRQKALDGGPYAYARLAFGDFVGFIAAWAYWLSIWIGNAAIAVALTASFSAFFPILNENNGVAALTTLAFIWLTTGLNVLGVRSAAIFQSITTVLRLLPILLICTWGFKGFQWQNMSAVERPDSILQAALSTAALTLWSFLGIESVTVPAAEVRNPERTIPLATWWGTLLSALIFVLACTAVMGMFPASVLQADATPFASAAFLLWGEGGSWIAAATCIACLGALNGWILLQGQIPAAAAKDGLFPAFFARKNQRGAPILALVISSVLMSGMVLFNFSSALQAQFQNLILLATLANLTPYALCSVAELAMSKEKSNSLWLRSIATFTFTLAAIIGCGWLVIWKGSLLLLGGVPVYFLLKKWSLTKTENK